MNSFGTELIGGSGEPQLEAVISSPITQVNVCNAAWLSIVAPLSS